MNTFKFDGVSSATYEAYIHSMYPAVVAKKSVETVEIPGKNGELIMPNGNYRNVDIDYQVVIKSGFRENYKALVARLLLPKGYRQLQDTWEPGYFRMARLTDWKSDVVSRDLTAGAATLTFNCMPQRYLTGGLQPTRFNASGIITNPTLFPAKPSIRVYGFGTLAIGGVALTIAGNSLQYIDIDCEAMDCFYGATNANHYVTLTGDTFPTLASGDNAVTLTGYITRVDITPRWWTL